MIRFKELSRLFSFKGSFTVINRNLSMQSSKVINCSALIKPPLNPWINPNNVEIKLPIIRDFLNLNFPPSTIEKILPLGDIPLNKVIEMPSSNKTIRKEAARLIVIRRRKMKKHKLKKLRKKMKFVWAKMRQKREWKKEKEFQAGLIKQCKEAEQFSAEAYVQERIDKFNLINKKNI